MNGSLRFFIFILEVTVVLFQGAGAGQLRAQDGFTGAAADSVQHPLVTEKPAYAYQQPTEQIKRENYLYDAFGPYPLTITAFIAGYHQARHNPPDWREGWPGFGMRYGSDFGGSVAGVTTRYVTAEALKEDTLYYRCGCSGVWPRLRHALASTMMARRGADGHRVVGIPGLAAPYATGFAEVYGWYPRRYSYKDAFRMGIFGLMDYALGNISLEFMPQFGRGKGKSLILRLHLDNRHAARAGESAP